MGTHELTHSHAAPWQFNMVRFQTEGICGYSVEFSPFSETRLACAGAQHFGIIGNGKQYILDTTGGAVRTEASFDTQDGLYDCAWSEENENHIVSASGDGSVKLWDIAAGSAYPMKSYEEHTHEVYSVDWNLVNKEYFVTGAWDDTIKLWSVLADASLTTYSEHQYCIYSTVWSPNNESVFASASGDYTVKVWISMNLALFRLSTHTATRSWLVIGINTTSTCWSLDLWIRLSRFGICELQRTRSAPCVGMTTQFGVSSSRLIRRQCWRPALTTCR